MSSQRWVRRIQRAAAYQPTRNRRYNARAIARALVHAGAALTVLGGFGLSPAALAAGEPEEALGQPTGSIVITGTRSERIANQEPYSIEVVGLEQIKRDLPRTVPEALTQLPGVLVQKTASGHGSPYIRGFTGNRTLLVIDGIRYNNATYRDGANEYFAQIDSFTLSQIELIAGPSSALYGSEAVGGVLSLTTLATGMRERSGKYVGGEQVARLSSGDGSLVSRSALEIGHGGKWGTRGGVTWRDYNAIRAAELGSLPYTGYGEYALDARVDIALGANWLATLNHQALNQDNVPRTHSTVFSVPFAGTTIGTDLIREKDHSRSLTYLKLRGALEQLALDTIEITLSRQVRTEDEVRIRADGLRIDERFDSELMALSAIASSQLRDMELTYGLDFSREDIDSARSDTDAFTGLATPRLQGPVGDEARYDQFGVFVRGVLPVGDRLTLDLGLRGSWIDASIGRFADPETNTAISFAGGWSNLSGSLRGRWSGGPHTIWAGYSRSFRAPNVADISRFGQSRTNEIEVASLSLEPETFDTVELAYRFRSDSVQAGLTAYATALNDYIATVPTGRIRDGLIEVAKRNAATGHIRGVEFSLNAALGSGISIEGNATWLRGRLTAPTTAGPIEEPISRVQPLSGNLALSWENDAFWARFALQVADRADQLSSGDLLDTQRIPPGGTPAYALLNLSGGFELTQGAMVTLSLNNLFNEAYRAHGSGSNEPGRHIVGSVSLQF